MSAVALRRIRLFISTLYAAVLAGFLAVLFNYSFEMISGPLFHEFTHQFPLRFQDFLRFYSIGQILCSDEKMHVYDPEVQLRFFNALISPAHTDKVMFVQHPPFLFSFFIPFASLPLNQSYGAWFICSILFGSAPVILLLLQKRKLSILQLFSFFIGFAVCLPAWRAHYIGQLSWFLVGLFAFYVWALLVKRRVLAGAMLALTLAKLQYLPFLLLPLMANRSKKLLVSFAVSVVLLLCIAGTTVGWSNVFGYPFILLSTESSQDVGLFPEEMVCLRGPLSCFPRPIALFISGASGLLAFMFLVAIWWRYRTPTEQEYRWLISLTLIAALVFAPHVHHYDCLILAIPAALTLTTVDPFEAVKLPSRPFRCWTLLFIVYPAFSWIVSMLTFLGDKLYYLFTIFDISMLILCYLVLQSLKPSSLVDQRRL